MVVLRGRDRQLPIPFGPYLAVAGLVAEGETVIENADCIADSFPGFGNVLRSLGATLLE